MSRGKQRLLLIRGLGHSGTTILDLALGAHPQITGLGEAVRLLEKPAAKDSHRGPAQLRAVWLHTSTSGRSRRPYGGAAGAGRGPRRCQQGQRCEHILRS